MLPEDEDFFKIVLKDGVATILLIFFLIIVDNIIFRFSVDIPVIYTIILVIGQITLFLAAITSCIKTAYKAVLAYKALRDLISESDDVNKKTSISKGENPKPKNIQLITENLEINPLNKSNSAANEDSERTK